MNEDSNFNGKNLFVERALAAFQKEYVVVGKTRVRAWRAWLLIGVAVGVVAGIFYIANRSGEVDTSEAKVRRNTVSPLASSGNLPAGVYDGYLPEHTLNKVVSNFMFIPGGSGYDRRLEAHPPDLPNAPWCTRYNTNLNLSQCSVRVLGNRVLNDNVNGTAVVTFAYYLFPELKRGIKFWPITAVRLTIPSVR